MIWFLLCVLTVLFFVGLVVLSSWCCALAAERDNALAEIGEQRQTFIYRLKWISAQLPHEPAVTLVCRALEVAVQHDCAVNTMQLERALNAVKPEGSA